MGYDIRLRNMTSVFLTDGEKLLCLYRVGSRVADHMYIGSAGGHFEENELNDPRRCVLREMQEELGLSEDDVLDLRLRYVTCRLKNKELRQNYYFFARLKEKRELTSTEGTLHWIDFEDVPDLFMPVSAKHMILHYLETGRFTHEVYAAVTEAENTGFVPLREFDDKK